MSVDLSQPNAYPTLTAITQAIQAWEQSEGVTVRHHLAAGVAIILSPYALRDVRAEIMCAPGTRWVPTLDGRVVPDEERPDGYVGDLFGLPVYRDLHAVEPVRVGQRKP